MANRLSFGILLCVALLIPLSAQGEEIKSFREALIAEGTVTRVYAVDDYHSLVVGEVSARTGDVTNEFDNKMQELCIKYGGTPEWRKLVTKEVSSYDPITHQGEKSETRHEWLPFEQEKNKEKGIFTPPWLTLNKYTPRCSSVFEVVERFGRRFKSGAFAYQSFLLKHNKPQPFIYKSPTIPLYDAITMPTDGEFKLPRIGEGFIGILKNLSNTPKYYGEDMFQYTSALCRKNMGELTFVFPQGKPLYFANSNEAVNKIAELGLNLEEIDRAYLNITNIKDKPLVLIVPTETKNLPEAFIYRSSAVIEGKSSMLFACMGGKKFVIREDFRRDDYKAFFASNRGLEGVSYITKEVASKMGLQDNTSSSGAFTTTPLTSTVPTEPPKSAISFEEQMAYDVATQKSPTIKIRAGSEYTGRYNGVSEDGCDLVSVKRVWDPTLKGKGRVDVNNYKVCQGKVAALGETGVESVPENVRRYIPEVARACQKKGTSKFDFGDYVIACTALRDQSMCNVEVNVLKEGKLIESKVVNGCQ